MFNQETGYTTNPAEAQYYRVKQIKVAKSGCKHQVSIASGQLGYLSRTTVSVCMLWFGSRISECRRHQDDPYESSWEYLITADLSSNKYLAGHASCAPDYSYS